MSQITILNNNNAGTLTAPSTTVGGDTTFSVPALLLMDNKVKPLPKYHDYFAHISGYIIRIKNGKEFILPSFYRGYRKVCVNVKGERELVYLLIEAFGISYKPTDTIDYSITDDGRIPVNSIKIKSISNSFSFLKNKQDKAIIKFKCDDKASSANSRGSGIISPLEVYNCLVRHEFKCFYCWKNIVNGNWHLDHFIPISKTGANDSKNIVPSCPQCNKMKGDLSYDDFARKCEIISDIYKHLHK